MQKINFQDLPNTTTPITATNLNTVQTNVENAMKNIYTSSTTDTYSCDYINDRNTYSTSEINTGKTWIDGKPIYRKVFNYTGVFSQVNGSDTTIGSIANFAEIVSLSGILKVGSNWQQIPFINYTYNSISVENINSFRLWVSSTEVKLKCYRGSNVPEQTLSGLFVVVEYTKSS